MFSKKEASKQTELAAITGTKPHYLSDIERGRANPRIELLARLAAALDITIDELVDW
ncbi:helix-turn-helix domain-containing protein [Desulfosporosinus fructosivorans]